MNYEDLANLIFPNIDKTIEDYRKIYPKRKEGLVVTRFAPSPTGFMHIGNFQSALIDYVLAKNNSGIFILRNEDTDKEREKEGSLELIIETLKEYNMTPDEYQKGKKTIGNYGPYIQSQRKEIYQAFIKHFIKIGRAYPCFCSKEELDEVRHTQESFKIRTGYYGEYATCRTLSIEEAAEKIKNNTPFIIRFKSTGDPEKRFKFDDLVKGKIFMPENDLDIVIMKQDGLPTYHFAHLVDDYLMGTTHVVRGEEWLSSVPIHIELFNTLNVPAPKYIHTPLIMKKEDNKIRKISKRKDPEASMDYYTRLGYPKDAVIESLMTIINTNYEQWHTENPEKNYLDFQFDPRKMSASGGLYDLDKLENISKNIISKMTKECLFTHSYKWSQEYSKSLTKLIEKDKEYYKNILNIEREKPKPRKDISKYSDIENNIWYMYDDLYYTRKLSYEYQKITNKEQICTILNLYLKSYLDLSNQENWFNNIKKLSETLGYASNMKDYKTNPNKYKGNVADISTVLRVSLISKSMSPDLYEIMTILGKERVEERYNKVINEFSN